MEGSLREPAHGCSDQAELGTGIRTHPPRRAWKVRCANRRTVAPTEPNLERKKNATAWKVRPANRRTVAPSKPNLERKKNATAWKVRLANRRTVAPTKPNLERKKNTPAPPGMEGSLREPANGCSDQAELGTENERDRMEGSPCESANGCSDQAELKTENECTRPAGHGRFALRTGERLLQPSRAWNGDTNAPAWKVRPANRRTVAPTKPNLERKMNATAPPGMEGSPPRTGARLLRPSRT